MNTTESPSIERVRNACRERGHEIEIVTFPSSTRSAAEAASSIGCTVEQIAKSIVFRANSSNECVLVILSGPCRVSPLLLEKIIGDRISRADADFVREKTGFAIGGVPPLGHVEPVKIILDSSLAEQPEIWAAAGTPNAVFRTTFQDLISLTGAEVRDVAER